MAVEHSFADALSAWKDINLSDVQRNLDSQGIEILDSQKESGVGRKALAERTKDFKKIPDDEKLNAFRGLLKAYQTEIDSLTRRCKSAENAFLGVYKLLAEAPDPYPLLELAVDQTIKVSQLASLESEGARLRQENADLQARVDSMSGSDWEKRKAEKRVEVLEEKLEELVKERVTAKENELKATYDERFMNYEEREKDLQRQVTTVRAQLRDLRSSNETKEAQLMDHTQRQGQETVARLAELDLIVADLDRANSRVASVERRNEQLRAELEASRSGTDSESSAKIKILEATVESLEQSRDQLSRMLEKQKNALAESERDHSRKLSELGNDLASKSSEIDSLKKKISKLKDYDEIKRELEIMKYVEFAGAEIDTGEDWDFRSSSNDGMTPSEIQVNSLEALLAAKNKRLQDELAKFRILHAELERTAEEASSELARTRSDYMQQRELNERLEQDLFQLHNVDKERPESPSTWANSNDPLAVLGVDQSGNAAGAGPSNSEGGIPFVSSAETSILPIVTSQRDRFRQRNAELEEEIRKQFTLISELRSEIKSLQGDNLKLYEKVRYMQSYREESGSSRGASANPFEPLGEELGKYKARYEERMNPFTAFQSQEATRAVQALNPLEGAVFALTRYILGSRRARITFIAYIGVMHAMVLFTTYECLISSGTGTRTAP